MVAEMSGENVEIVRRGYAHLAATGDMLPEIFAPDFVWDMSKFESWPEQQLYEGIDGARKFLQDWTEPWDDWQLEALAFHDAGDKVVAILHQSGRSKATGLVVDMDFGMVWTIRGSKQARMEMYADPAQALAAAGLTAT